MHYLYLVLYLCIAILFSNVGAAEAKKFEKGKILAGYDDGFFLASSDGNFRLEPSFALQLQHKVEIKERDNDTNGFFIRRGRVKFEGNALTKDLTYEIEFDMGTPDEGDPQFDLKDLYFDYLLNSRLHIKAGQFKTPFGFQELTSSKKLQFVDRSLASEEFVQGSDIGVMFWGPDEGAPVEYYLGAFNGDGDNNFNGNTDLIYVGNISYMPLGKYKKGESDLKGEKIPRLVFGLGGIYGPNAADGDYIYALAGNAGLKYSGLSIRGEYFYRDNLDDTSIDASSGDAHGFYTQAGYFFVPKKLEFALRASQFYREGDFDDEEEYSVGMNYFFFGNKLKIQMDYTLNIDENKSEGNALKNHIVRTQFQMAF